MHSPIKAVILAGGSGTRLWPMSRQQMPKQFLCLDGELSLLEATVARLDPIISTLSSAFRPAFKGRVWRRRTGQ